MLDLLVWLLFAMRVLALPREGAPLLVLKPLYVLAFVVVALLLLVIDDLTLKILGGC